LVVEHAGATIAVLSLDVAGGRVRRSWSIRNPEKLRPWTG
jgi:RNA polymerase sigma-70 factor (ECF subfamily)